MALFQKSVLNKYLREIDDKRIGKSENPETKISREVYGGN